jgi:hypothetical protein
LHPLLAFFSGNGNLISRRTAWVGYGLVDLPLEWKGRSSVSICLLQNESNDIIRIRDLKYPIYYQERKLKNSLRTLSTAVSKPLAFDLDICLREKVRIQ